MNAKPSPLTVTISGVTNSGQIVVGDHNSQIQNIQAGKPIVTPEEKEELQRLLDELAEQIAQTAPDDQKEPALQRADELKDAVLAPEPDLSTMEYVKGWFSRNLPALAGAITSIIVNPIVGKLVEAAGDVVAGEFRRRFNVD
jgi:hypothetical protein